MFWNVKVRKALVRRSRGAARTSDNAANSSSVHALQPPISLLCRTAIVLMPTGRMMDIVNLAARAFTSTASTAPADGAGAGSWAGGQI